MSFEFIILGCFVLLQNLKSISTKPLHISKYEPAIAGFFNLFETRYENLRWLMSCREFHSKTTNNSNSMQTIITYDR